MKKKLLFVLFMPMFLVFICFCTNPVSEDSKQIESNDPLTSDKQYDVYITGKILDPDNKPTSGVIVSLPSKDLSDTTQSDGVYRILAKKNDAGEEVLSKKQTEPIVSDSLSIEKAGQLISKIEITSLIDTLPDMFIVQRNIWGELVVDSGIEIGTVHAKLSGDGLDNEKKVAMWYNKASNSYSGYVYFYHSAVVKNYQIKIEIYDKDSIIIGKSSVIEFPSTAGDIKIATFPAYNPPVIYTEPDTVVSFTTVKNVEITIDTSKIITQNSIKKYYWGKAANELNDTTLIPTYNITATNGGRVKIYWAVSDYDNLMSSTDSFSVFFNRPPESLLINIPAADDFIEYSRNKKVVNYSAFDPDGTEDSLFYKLYLGKEIDLLEEMYFGSDTTFEIETLCSLDSFAYRLKVVDRFGDSAEISGIISNPGPPVEWFCFNDSVTGGNTQIEFNSEKSSASIKFSLGDAVEMPEGWLMSPYFGFGTFLFKQHEYNSIADVKKIVFKIKSDQKMDMDLKISTNEIDTTYSSPEFNESEYGSTVLWAHGKTFKIDTIWTEISINVNDLSLPNWTKKVDWNPNFVKTIQWVFFGETNVSSVNEGIIQIADIALEFKE